MLTLILLHTITITSTPSTDFILSISRLIASIDVLNKPKGNKQTAALRRLETYHTPMALPDQRVKRLPNMQTSPQFKAAKRKLFWTFISLLLPA
ncbi:hypothetical protein G6F42_016257 [Rhizopus arrhizus]|nr:hypothetical protein G6F42_016257 [Rhizopus arrhizus]